MDIFRKIILAGIFLTAYLLFWNWQNDYGQSVKQLSSDKPINSLISPHISGIIKSSNSNTQQVAAHNFNDNDLYLTVKTKKLILVFSKIDGSLVKTGLIDYPDKIGSNLPFNLLDNSINGYYVVQSGFLPEDSVNTSIEKGDFQCNNCITAYDGQHTTIDISKEYDEYALHKIFTIDNSTYEIKESITVNNISKNIIKGSFYSQIVRGNQQDPGSQSGIRLSSFLGTAWWSPAKPYNKKSLKDVISDGKPVEFQENGGWVAFVQHYFIAAIIPDHKENMQYNIRSEDNKAYLTVLSNNYSVLPGKTIDQGFNFYIGPKITSNLEKISNGLDLTIDYGWLWPIAEFLFIILTKIHGVIGNWGWSIILLTIVVKLAFLPLSAASYRSMAQMRKLAPEIERLKEKFGNDRQKMSTAMMEFYRQEKINPLGGCLPMLVQMPVFIALYWTLMESVQLRHSSFIFWIHDLSDMDHFFILPLLMGISMYLQQGLNPAPADPVQAKMMKFMPVIFTGFFLFFPSGLVLYWLVSNIFSIVQQSIITRRYA